MTPLIARAVRVLVGATLLVACASSVEHPPPGGPAFDSDEVRFTAPTGWRLQPSTAVFFGGDTRIRTYVANQPLRADCDTELGCQSPLVDGLGPGGMLVTWVARGCVARSCDLPAGQLMSIGNRVGVNAVVDDGCEDIGFTERSAYYVTVSPQRMDILFVCARDPSESTDAVFLGFLDAIQWRVP